VAVVEKRATSTRRLAKLASHLVERLAERHLPGAEAEVAIPGGGRPKNWDVAWKAHGKYRLAISLKSILHNLPGTVPNRLDDLMGEVANAQLYSPEIVAGYVMVFDVGQDAPNSDGRLWCEVLEERLSGRRGPHWSIGTIEAAAVVRVDFRNGPRVVAGEERVEAMLDVLATEVRARNPGV
jgi:hypothetical protein